MTKFSLLLTLIATGLLAQTTPPAFTGSVSGHVVDADTNMPIVGVRVDARVDRSAGAPATTDSQGRYVFENLPPGKRSIEVYDGNLGPSMTPPQTVTVIGGRDAQVDFHTGLFAQVSGRVLDEDGTPVTGIQVAANRKEYDGVRDLVVAAIPRSTVSGELVWDKPPTEAAIRSIRVTTYPSTGRAIPLLTPPVPGTFSLSVVAGSSYITAISGLDSHSYVKDVTYGGSSILYQPFVPSGGDAKLRITIGSDAGSITAAVLAANGQPAAGSAVLIVPITARTEPDVAAAFRAGITDENGTYLESGLPPGKYDVFAISDPPPNRIDRGQIMLIDRTPDAIDKILHARARGKQVDVGPGSAASVSLAPIRLD